MKPRQWWIVERFYEPGDDEFDLAYDYEQKRTNREVCHVIEKSAYDQLMTHAKAMRDALTMRECSDEEKNVIGGLVAGSFDEWLKEQEK